MTSPEAATLLQDSPEFSEILRSVQEPVVPYVRQEPPEFESQPPIDDTDQPFIILLDKLYEAHLRGEDTSIPQRDIKRLRTKPWMRKQAQELYDKLHQPKSTFPATLIDPVRKPRDFMMTFTDVDDPKLGYRIPPQESRISWFDS